LHPHDSDDKLKYGGDADTGVTEGQEAPSQDQGMENKAEEQTRSVVSTSMVMTTASRTSVEDCMALGGPPDIAEKLCENEEDNKALLRAVEEVAPETTPDAVYALRYEKKESVSDANCTGAQTCGAPSPAQAGTQNNAEATGTGTAGRRTNTVAWSSTSRCASWDALTRSGFDALAYICDCAADDLREVLSLAHAMALENQIGYNAMLGDVLDIVEDNRADDANCAILQHMEEEMRRYVVPFPAQGPPEAKKKRPKVNDPCPCGTGRKFKKCCGKGG
jgi:hypothetical protein